MADHSQSINLDEAERFLALLDSDPVFTFQTFDDDEKRQDKKLAKTLHGTLEQHGDTLKRLNEAGAGIFFTVNKTDGSGRRKAPNIIGIRALYVDKDNGPVDDVLKHTLPPHIVVKTSGHKGHAYFRIEPGTLDLADFRSSQKKLIESFNSDQVVCDLPRVMRLPGFLHMKDRNAPQYVRMTHADEERPSYHGRQFYVPPKQANAEAAENPNIASSEDAKRFLASECAKLAESRKPGRNALLNKIAYTLGGVVGSKQLSEDDVRQALDHACETCGLLAGDEYRKTIDTRDRALADGKEIPLRLSGKPKESIPKLPALAPAVWPTAASIPRLDRLYGSHYVRGFVSVTAGPGGIGKSSLSQAEVVMMLAHIGMVEGRLSPRPLNVLYVNLEDDLDQIWRHFLATASHYGIDPKELEGKLFVHSGQDQPIKIAELKKHDVRVWTELVDELIQFVLANNIDVVIFDPFVSLHNVNENDNGQIDAVMKELGRLASKGKCAVDVIHHSRKTNGEGQSVETIRGARSLTDAARMARVIDTMTETEAENFGLLGFDANGREKPSYRRYIYERPAKQNLAPPADKRCWYLLVSVPVGNAGKEQDLEPSDWVGVPTSWSPPEGEPLFEDDKLPDLLKLFENSDQRVSDKAKDWAGYAIGELLDYDMGRGMKSADVLARHKSARKRAQQVIDELQQRGLIIEEDRKDSNREVRPTWILTNKEIPF
ncbi:AAA family ATPase [Mesorhizobium sp. M0915]|uniref:AAA family ATPase n=1 Tax=Mesorhizobium sp. M0915 TaxID=2957027 RepID=UPI003335CE47